MPFKHQMTGCLAMLTAKQKCFVQEYLVDLNATQAAIRAGYSEKTAGSVGNENLNKPEIQAAIADAQRKRSSRTEITQDRVLSELAKIGFSDIRKAVRWGRNPGDTESANADPNGLNIYPVSLVGSDEIDDDTAAAVAEVSLTQTGVKIKLHDKLSALEKIGKHLGMFKDAPSDPDEAPRLNIHITTAAPVQEVRVTRSDA